MRLSVQSILLLFSVLSQSFGADLGVLDKGRDVHLVMVGHGLLCDAKVQERSPDKVTVKLLRSTSECGQKGELLRLTNQEVKELVPEERLTKRRVAAKILLGVAGVAALCAVPLTSSDPESWLLVGNPVIPVFVLYGAWDAVSRRRDYLILMTCSDSLHCFSNANGSSR